MKKISPLVAFVLAALITLFLHSTSVEAQELTPEKTIEACTSFSEMASDIMTERQRGTSREEARDIFNKERNNRLADGVIPEAWTYYPQVQSDGTKAAMIRDFAYENYSLCVSAFR